MASIKTEEYKKWERNKGKPEITELIRILNRKKGQKKIKRWKLKDESVKVEFEKSYEKRRETLKQSDKTQPEKTYENSMETGREICGETTGHFRIKRE